MKIFYAYGGRQMLPSPFRQLLLAMKLTAVLLMVVFLGVNAKSFSQSVTYQAKNIPLEQAFSAIRQQTGYTFFYNNADIPHARVSVSLEHASLSEALDRVLKGLHLNYSVHGKTIFLSTASAQANAPVAAQPDRNVSGKVTDAKGEALSGVSIRIKGRGTGTTTDNDGHFSLEVPENAVLEISFLGYETQDVSTNNLSVINITLQPSTTSLNQLVVVGYGEQQKATLTGSVAAISGDQIVKTKTENIINTLSGKIPGLRIVQNTAEPGAYNNTFDIRGFSASGSGGAVSSPLIVIDGVPQDQGVLQRLDPNDIASISILKDASAAVYGVQAANGVILVTTKRGKKGQMQISYGVTQMTQVVNKLPKLTNALQYLTLMNEMSMHNINNPVLLFPPSFVTPYQDGTLKSADWTTATMDKTAPEWQHSLTASGGSDKINYFLSFGYLKQDGFFKNNAENYRKYNFRSNIDAQITKRISLSMQLAGISDRQNTPSIADWNIFSTMWRNAPINPIYTDSTKAFYSNPSYNGYGFANSVAEITPGQSGYGLNKSQRFQGGLSLTYDVPYLDGLKAKAFYNYNYNVQDNKNYNKTYTVYNPGANPGDYVPVVTGGNNGQSQVSQYYASGNTGFLQFSLNYTHTFAKIHHVEALALYEQQTSSGNIFQAERYETLNTDQLSAGSAANQIGQGVSVNPSASKSEVGKLHYDYNSKYLVDFTIRRDGSSLFPPSKPYGVFPGVTAAYRISEEPFFKRSKGLSFIDNLKIRGSYGILGDASGTNGYNFVGGYNYPAGNPNPQNLPPGSVFNGEFVNGLGFRGLTNPNITWYTARTTDFGLDADFWNGKLQVTVDYFNRYRTGLLATELLNLPGSVGATLPQENLNSDETRGYDLSVASDQQFGKLFLHLGGNLTYARTRWIKYIKAAQGSDYADWVNNGDVNGRYNDVWFGYGYEGQFQSISQIQDYPVNEGGGNRGNLPGDYIYQDWNQDGYFDGGDIHPVAGTKPVNSQGTATPSAPIINFGFNIGASYDGFDLTALFQGAAGKWISYPIAYSYPLDHNGNSFAKFLNDWHPSDPTANPYDPHTVWVPGYYAYTGTHINASSTGPGGVNNAAYVRLKSLELGYTLPDHLLSKVNIKSLRIFVNGYDLLTITGLKGVDPEHPSDLYGDQYPLNHILSAGLNVTF